MRSSRPEKKWTWYDVDWSPFRKIWFKSSLTKMISLSYSKLVMSHDPTFKCLFDRSIISSPLCPCGVDEDTHHYCFVCPLLPPPDPTYTEVFISKTPSNLRPIASLLCDQVLTFSDRYLPSYESRWIKDEIFTRNHHPTCSHKFDFTPHLLVRS